jgi:3' terminal RNA ribose 2'-O-methyltransferase Hen1
MLLTITTTYRPATDLGFLLRKNPARVQTFELSFGKAQVFYPQADDDCCTAALLVEVDPIALVRTRRGPAGEGRLLEHYVNDRPYAASSFLSVAIAQVFDAALGGRAKERPELAETPIPLRAVISVLPCRGGEEFLRRLFEPLGYCVTASRLPLDERFPEWGESSYFRVELEATLRLYQLLSHLYVLMPVLDNDKHYWVGDDEVDKLLRHGEGWLDAHPQRDAIARRYLKHRRSLVADVLSQLSDAGDPRPDETAEARAAEEEAIEKTLSLNEQRLRRVLEALKASGSQSVLDLGCGEGKLLRLLLSDRQFTKIVGMDVSHRVLEFAADNLNYDRLPTMQKERIKLLHGSLMYRDARLAGFDAAAVVEVIEHLDPPRLAAFERVLFEFARPTTVVLTTPNSEYNVMWESLPAGKFRHRDHRFEWSRSEFQRWANNTAKRFGYRVQFQTVGPVNDGVGSPTQMAVFSIQKKT